MALAIPFVLFSCNDAELEKRVSDLEKRVAEMETKSVASANRQVSNSELNRTNTPTTQTQEVKPEGPTPEFKFDQESFDFGQIIEGEVVEHTFRFTNTGEAPLIIEKATASCGCTVPDYSKDPIAPGGTGEILVKFNSRNKVGKRSNVVTINANTYPSVKRLTIKSDVVKG
ncbi:MAG: DUF1573 domain-containing protein [Cyclobacteriaceae bacterium]|nr:DUF1573 domain-containing protein [Cyclobacteriaceae bacterium]